MLEQSERTAGLKERLRIPHTPYRKRDPQDRIGDFDDIVIGYEAEIAKCEASRCIQCPYPAACLAACPLHNDIPGALWLISQGDFLGAAKLYHQTSPMPEICGRVCPQERLCEGACVLSKYSHAPALGQLEVFVTDYQRLTKGWDTGNLSPLTGKTVAVIGSGPAGLTVAEALIKHGHSVTVFEAAPYPGGLLMYGIPSFKLPKALVKQKIEYLQDLGVGFVCNTRIGEQITLDDLFQSGFQAIFIGIGANVDAKLNLPGVDLAGICQSGDFLFRTIVTEELTPEALRMKPLSGKRVAVLGGGDTATDCLRTALRLWADEVKGYYRRTEAEMPGSRKERAHALEEGAQIEYLVAPTQFIGNQAGHVCAMELQRMALGAPDASNRRRPIPVAGSEFTVPVDMVVLALGYQPDETIGQTTPGLKTHQYGLIKIDPATGRTSRPGVFAGGDAATGPDLVSTAIAAGLRAAEAMHQYLLGLA